MSKIVKGIRRVQDERKKQDDAVNAPPQKFARMEVKREDFTDEHAETAVLPRAMSRSSRIVRIDKKAMRDAGLISPLSERKLFENEYRVIKRPILANASSSNSLAVKNGYVVLVSSALSGDGKTFTCINLALSLAREQDTSVLLIDADLPKPHITTLFDTEDESGLLDFLDGSVSSIDEIELRTSVNGLTLLPAGKSRENATELVSSDRMLELLELVHRRDPRQIVLIDSSPLLQTTESRAMASVAGQIVLVVRAGMTPKAAVLDAVATLDLEKPTNLVLNQVRYGRSASNYGGYYGRYGSAYGETVESQK